MSRLPRRASAAICALGLSISFSVAASGRTGISTPLTTVSDWAGRMTESARGVLPNSPREFFETAAAAAAQQTATVEVNRTFFQPGTQVTVTGSGWQPGETVTLQFDEQPYVDGPHIFSTTALPDGTLYNDQFWTDATDAGINFTLTATGATSGLRAQTTFTDDAAASLDQCANDPAPSPHTDGCATQSNQWVSGNVGASKANYLEGDFLPYRLVMSGLSLTSHTVTIEWDTTKSDKHALDYIGTVNATVANANPCLGIAGCNTFTTFPIPADPQVTGAGVTQAAGNFRMYGGTITAVSAYSYADGAGFVGDKSARITITFTASSATPVLAWAGHIASHGDWGDGNAAVNISGSPYHTRLIALDGSGGNQDRSLSSDAVIFPASITVIKNATPDGATSFPFTASPSPLANFNLVDDGTTANTKLFGNITNFTTYTVAESVPSGWVLSGVSCGVTSPNGGSQNVNSATVTINLKEGENVTCTYNDRQANGSIKIVKTIVGGLTGQSYTFNFVPSGFGSGFSLTVAGPNGTTESSVYSSLPITGTYSIAETPLTNGWDLTSSTCTNGTPSNIIVTDGGLTTCTFTNTENQNVTRGKLVIKKIFDPLTSGFNGSFSVPYSCTDGTAGTATLAAGGQTPPIAGIAPGSTCTATEPTLPAAPSGWTFGAPSFNPASGSVSISAGVTSEITVTNTIARDTGSLRIVKSFDPLTSGFNSTFAINYDCNDGTSHDGTANLGAGGETTITGIPTGTSCTVSEPTLPTAPTGWTFGTPSVVTSPQVITAKDTTYTVTVTNTISRDLGSLKIVKSFDPLTSGFVGTFAINYDCNDGTNHDGTANLAAGGETTITGIPTGTSCTVTEPTLPTAPTGWTFGTPSVVTSPQVITAKDTTYTVTVTNTITRDQGYLKISKTFDAKTSGFTSTFAVVYNCGAGDVTVNLAGGGSTTVGPFNTGTSCTVTEPTLPTAPTGWTFGTPSISGSPATITKGDQAAAVGVTVANSITRDQGYLKITKVFNPLTSGFAGTFAINYLCGQGGPSGTVNLAAGASQTVGPFDTGLQCAVREPNLPTAPTGWTFGTPSVSGNPATIVKGDQAAAVTLTVTNTITRNVGALTITKVVQGGGSGFTGTFGYNVVCTGDGGSYSGTIAYPTPGSVTISNIPTGNLCTVTETSQSAAPTGYTWTSTTGTISGSPAAIAVSPTAAVQITNTATALANVTKTVNGVAPAAGQTFTFQLRQDATTSSDGTILETKTTDASGGLSFTTALTPATTYQICELVLPGWNTNLTGDGPLFVPNSIIPPSLPNPNVNNLPVCANFTVSAGTTRTFTVDNTPPPGGRALTIGFWKNWASCSGSGGGQKPMLDLALAIATQQTPTPPDGMVVSAQTMGAGWPTFGPAYYLVLAGNPSSTPSNILPAPSCAYAVALLDKRTTVSGKKMASDPLFNMTAQLVAAEANRFMGAGISGDTIMNINKAVLLDGKYQFNGNTYSGKLTAADTNLANCLATQLDNYNNNRPVAACP